MSTYLLTGCAGFIGSRVTELLLGGGHTVIGIDNLCDSYDARLKRWRLSQLEGRVGFSFHNLDISRAEDLYGLTGPRTIEAVINLAARAGVRRSVECPQVYFEANTIGTLNLLELCRRRDIRKLVLSSTSSLYGNASPIPYLENSDTDHPLSPYAASKKAAEVLCSTYHDLHGIDVTVFRYFTVYGPAGRPDMLPFRLVQWISEGRPVTVYGDGLQARDFTYVDDIARGTIAGLKNVGYEIVNLGADTPVAVLDAIRVFEVVLGKKAQLVYKPRHSADVQITCANIAKAGSLLNWRPRVGFEAGVQSLVSWYLENRDWASTINTSD